MQVNGCVCVSCLGLGDYVGDSLEHNARIVGTFSQKLQKFTGETCQACWVVRSCACNWVKVHVIHVVEIVHTMRSAYRNLKQTYCTRSTTISMDLEIELSSTRFHDLLTCMWAIKRGACTVRTRLLVRKVSALVFALYFWILHVALCIRKLCSNFMPSCNSFLSCDFVPPAMLHVYQQEQISSTLKEYFPQKP